MKLREESNPTLHPDEFLTLYGSQTLEPICGRYITFIVCGWQVELSLPLGIPHYLSPLFLVKVETIDIYASYINVRG